ncbi:hypothetical protein Bbelb_014020 [Branchiostoma belcheri]|nr:hypothetical protein Bbelb_014020 [Branchiostoma belcheri]
MAWFGLETTLLLFRTAYRRKCGFPDLEKFRQRQHGEELRGLETTSLFRIDEARRGLPVVDLKTQWSEESVQMCCKGQMWETPDGCRLVSKPVHLKAQSLFRCVLKVSCPVWETPAMTAQQTSGLEDAEGNEDIPKMWTRRPGNRQIQTS